MGETCFRAPRIRIHRQCHRPYSIFTDDILYAPLLHTHIIFLPSTLINILFLAMKECCAPSCSIRKWANDASLSGSLV